MESGFKDRIALNYVGCKPTKCQPAGCGQQLARGDQGDVFSQRAKGRTYYVWQRRGRLSVGLL